MIFRGNYCEAMGHLVREVLQSQAVGRASVIRRKPIESDLLLVQLHG